MIQDSFQLLLPELQKMDASEVKKCNIPIAIYINEASLLCRRVDIDLPRLLKVNMPETLPRELKIRTEALIIAESIWQNKTSARQNNMTQWKEKGKQLKTLFYDLIHELSFAFRNKPPLLASLREARKAGSYAMIIQSLSDILVLAQEHKHLLKAINFNMTKLDTASEMLEDASKLLAITNSYRLQDDQDRVLRDKAYTSLKLHVDEVRAYGQFVFKGEKDILQHYASSYAREKQRNYRKKANSL
ncbi:hypothetical protein [Carboxylicivirga sp. M1479]|uniref:hypothetical protein n=1 Tax=Carboxylicivirga sp. M1479 TaxID=2594476 RepID=UPI00117890BB|nr:hypothetical protein [Carboxylicivirga sp. M1479]TRX72655.1 hypothetical protein FNN09_01565 [Carboxylicivirga sp. M1479]